MGVWKKAKEVKTEKIERRGKVLSDYSILERNNKQAPKETKPLPFTDFTDREIEEAENRDRKQERHLRKKGIKI